MPKTECQNCCGTYWWRWEEAFEKFGFSDGEGQIMTETVADILRTAGYDVTVQAWGIHNIVISAIAKDGVSLITEDSPLGYDNPRDYLPAEIVNLLDQKLPEDGEVEL